MNDNCQQLLVHDNIRCLKKIVKQVLCDRLRNTEMELATLKLERLNLSAGTHLAVSQPTCSETVQHMVRAASVDLLGSFGKDS